MRLLQFLQMLVFLLMNINLHKHHAISSLKPVKLSGYNFHSGEEICL